MGDLAVIILGVATKAMVGEKPGKKKAPAALQMPMYDMSSKKRMEEGARMTQAMS